MDNFNQNFSSDSRILRLIIVLQSLYYLVTALWALFAIESFMAVTGPKTDIWLVKTVASLILVIAVSLGAGTLKRIPSLETTILAILSCVAFIIVDVFYAGLTHTISRIYLLDGVGEAAFLALNLILARGLANRIKAGNYLNVN